AGHEGMAIFHPLLTREDWLQPHYRDRALLLARGVGPSAFFHGLLATEASPSSGRQMGPFLGDPSLHILAQSIPVGSQALHAVGEAKAIKDRPGHPIVFCSMGD